MKEKRKSCFQKIQKEYPMLGDDLKNYKHMLKSKFISKNTFLNLLKNFDLVQDNYGLYLLEFHNKINEEVINLKLSHKYEQDNNHKNIDKLFYEGFGYELYSKH